MVYGSLISESPGDLVKHAHPWVPSSRYSNSVFLGEWPRWIAHFLGGPDTPWSFGPFRIGELGVNEPAAGFQQGGCGEGKGKMSWDRGGGWGNSRTRPHNSWVFLTPREKWKVLVGKAQGRQEKTFTDCCLWRFKRAVSSQADVRHDWPRKGMLKLGWWPWPLGTSLDWQMDLIPPSLSPWVWDLTKHRGLVCSSPPKEPAWHKQIPKPLWRLRIKKAG